MCSMAAELRRVDNRIPGSRRGGHPTGRGDAEARLSGGIPQASYPPPRRQFNHRQPSG